MKNGEEILKKQQASPTDVDASLYRNSCFREIFQKLTDVSECANNLWAAKENKTTKWEKSLKQK